MSVVVGKENDVQNHLDGVQLPTVFSLEQNYPNPFNPSTTIPMTVPRTADVELKVFNILGRVVKTVFSGRVEAGRYPFSWDGRNESGTIVANGIYFARMRADGDFVTIQKMTLLK